MLKKEEMKCEIVSKELKLWKTKEPRVLGIDEVHIAKDMRSVFVDIENSTLLDMGEDNKKKTAKDIITSFENYECIEVVTMDMYSGYRNTIGEIYGSDKPVIVIDKFHVIKNLLESVSKVYRILRKDVEDEIKSISDKKEKNDKLRTFYKW